MKRSIVFTSLVTLVSLTIGIASANADSLGFKTEGGETNRITLFLTKYVGECPGWSTPSTKGWFFSEVAEISSGKGRKIKLHNTGVSGGDGTLTRSFKEANASKKIAFRPFEEFRINEGENVIDFDLFEEDNVLKQGRFTVLGIHHITEQSRNSEVTTKETCLSGDSPCISIETEVTRACPNGQVLEQFKVRGRYNPNGRSGTPF
jgi:hypothetical protein